jgi:transposase
MPSNHRMMSDWNPQRLLNWAKNIGEYTEAVVTRILQERPHPEQAFKVCLGILNLEKKYDRQRLNKACQRAIEYNLYSYKSIKNMLQNRVETLQQDIFEPSPIHENIRGKQYYQTGERHD